MGLKIRSVITAIFLFFATLYGGVSVAYEPVFYEYKERVDYDINIPEPRASIIGVLAKALAEILEPVFKVIGEIISELFNIVVTIIKVIVDGVSWVLGKIWDGLSWTYDQLGKLLDWLFSSSDNIVSKIIDTPDSLFKSEQVDIDSLDSKFFEEGNKPYIANMSVFLSIPTGKDDFSHTFSGKKPTELALKEIESVRSGVSELTTIYDEAIGSTLEGRSAHDFVRYLSETESQYVAIVGHNENSSFAFLEPPPISISKMAALCSNFKKKCIFLSCDSVDHIKSGQGHIGVNRKLSYLEAKIILNQVYEFLGNNREISTVALAKELESTIRKYILIENSKPTIKLLIVTSSGGSMLAGVSIVLEGSDN